MSTPEHREAEMAELRRRAAVLREAIEAQQQVEEHLRETEQRLGRILESTDEMIAFSVNGVIVEVNQRLADVFGYEMGEIVGRRILDLIAPESRDEVARAVATMSTEPLEVLGVRRDGERITMDVCGRPTTHQGRPARVAALRDITERKRAEEAIRTALVQTEVIRAQEASLAELSTPLLPITEEVVVLPLIGAVNSERAAQVQRTLVEGVASYRARTAILDITGVPDVDTRVADTMLQAARAVQLLGARVVLTGIRPEVAQRLVHLGVDLEGITTYGTLERGVAHALAQR